MIRHRGLFRRALCLLFAGLLLLGAPACAVELRASLWMTGADDATLQNVDAAIAQLSGAAVAPGEAFSLNGALAGAALVSAVDGGGQTVRGGGVDRVATVLARALRFGGYEIIEQSAFGAAFAGGYLADGAESVRIDPDAGQDLRFVNPYGQYTVLRLWREGSVLQCALTLTEALDAAPQADGAADEVILLPDVNEFLSLRSEPSTSASVIEKVLPGMRMRALGVSGIFYLVQVEESGNVGYVHSGYVTVEGEADERWPYSYEMMLADVAALVERAQGRVERETLCTTLDGREIPVLRFGDAQATNHILIQAGIHGREYITSRLAVDLLNDLVDSCEDGIDDVMFHVVPMANPDGAVISLQGPEALNDPALAEGVRQMLAAEGESHTMWKANARGTDLNRNFPEEWEELTGRTPGSDRYRGPSPLSEPETQALAGYLDRYDFAATISYHSYGSIIYWEGAYTSELEARNRALAELFAEKTGYALGVNEAETVERGGFKDWALGTRAIPSITVEIGAVDCFGSADEYAAILISHRGLWRQLADWAVENA